MEDKIKSMFVPYEMAVELKDLGFEQPCLASFFELKSPDEGIFTLGNEGSCPAAIWGQVTEWLREKHNIHIRIEFDYDMAKYSVMVDTERMSKVKHELEHLSTETEDYYIFDTYESALEEGIKAALTYIKQKNNG